MAASISQPFSIYRLTASGDTETSISDDEAVGMLVGISDAPSAHPVGLISYHPVNDARRTDVPEPDQQGSSVPDTGNVPLIFELDFIVNEKILDSKDLAKIQKWMLQPKIVRTGTAPFPKGRFGIRYDAKSWMSVIPDNEAGLKLLHFDFHDDLLWGGLVHCKVTLQRAGIPDDMITNINTFLAS